MLLKTLFITSLLGCATFANAQESEEGDPLVIPLSPVPWNNPSKVKVHLPVHNNAASTALRVARTQRPLTFYVKGPRKTFADLNANHRKDSNELWMPDETLQIRFNTIIYNKEIPFDLEYEYQSDGKLGISIQTALQANVNGELVTFYDDNLNGYYNDPTDYMLVGDPTKNTMRSPYCPIFTAGGKQYNFRFVHAQCAIELTPSNVQMVPFEIKFTDSRMHAEAIITHQTSGAFSLTSDRINSIAKGPYKSYMFYIYKNNDNGSKCGYVSMRASTVLNFEDSPSTLELDRGMKLECTVAQSGKKYAVANPVFKTADGIAFGPQLRGGTIQESFQRNPVIFLENGAGKRVSVGVLTPG